MTSPQAIHHSLLRPCVLHILRAAGYHTTRPSVLDTLTDLAARYMLLLASSTAKHAEHNQTALEVNIVDVRKALQDCGAVRPEKGQEDQLYDENEDTRGVEAFLEWIVGPENKEIRRIALDGSDEDYLTALKKKFDKTGDETRYQGTLLGNTGESRPVIVEGADVTSLKEWADRLRKNRNRPSSSSSRLSSDLSSIDMENMEF